MQNGRAEKLGTYGDQKAQRRETVVANGGAPLQFHNGNLQHRARNQRTNDKYVAGAPV